MREPIGLYIHVPFCLSKCPYCDFYSLPYPEPALLDRYTQAVTCALADWRERIAAPADTLYFGGGTPSLLGGKRLAAVIEASARHFGLSGAEITLEANPADDLAGVFRAFAAAGGNRVSLGMQSASDRELEKLGRRHRHAQTLRAAEDLHAAGIDNLSLDLMLGIEEQSPDSLADSIEACRQLGASHVSAYLLKIEEGTPFHARRDSLRIPDDDGMAALYLQACRQLEAAGFRQYEISNFARPGSRSRHNSKYWDLQPYLGIGPSAHSFLDGRRFFYPRDLSGFLEGAAPLPEDPEDSRIPDGSEAEYLMLRLRLTEGADESAYRRRFGRPLPAAFRQRAEQLARQCGGRWLQCDETGVRLTSEGFLLSNAIIARLLGEAING